MKSFEELCTDMDRDFLDPDFGFGSLVVLELGNGEIRPDVKAIVDTESKNAGLHGGSVSGVIGFAEISPTDAAGVAKDDVFVWGGVRYSIISHPILLSKNWVQLELGVIGEQSIPNIRY